MKKLIFLAGMIIGVTIGFVPMVLAQGLDTGVLTCFTGKVEIKFVETGQWEPAEKGLVLKRDDLIKTDVGALAEIMVGKKEGANYIIRMEEDTLITLQGDAQIESVLLPKGKVFTAVSNLKKGSTFEVHTPTTVSGVRGSCFGVEASESREEHSAFEHTLHVDNYDTAGEVVKSVDIPQGYKINIDTENHVFSEPARIDVAELVQVQEWRSEAQERAQEAQPAQKTEEKPAEGDQQQMKPKEQKPAAEMPKPLKPVAEMPKPGVGMPKSGVEMPKIGAVAPGGPVQGGPMAGPAMAAPLRQGLSAEDTAKVREAEKVIGQEAAKIQWEKLSPEEARTIQQSFQEKFKEMTGRSPQEVFGDPVGPMTMPGAGYVPPGGMAGPGAGYVPPAGMTGPGAGYVPPAGIAGPGAGYMPPAGMAGAGAGNLTDRPYAFEPAGYKPPVGQVWDGQGPMPVAVDPYAGNRPAYQPGFEGPGGYMPPAGFMGPGGYVPPAGMEGQGYVPPGGMAGPGYTPPAGMEGPGGYMPPAGFMGPGGYVPPAGMEGQGYVPPGGMAGPGYTPPAGFEGPGYVPPGGYTPPAGFEGPGGYVPPAGFECPGYVPPSGEFTPPAGYEGPAYVPPVGDAPFVPPPTGFVAPDGFVPPPTDFTPPAGGYTPPEGFAPPPTDYVPPPVCEPPPTDYVPPPVYEPPPYVPPPEPPPPTEPPPG